MAAASFPPFGAVSCSEVLLLRRMVHSLQVEVDKLRKEIPWCTACKEKRAEVCSEVCKHLFLCLGCYGHMAAGGQAFNCPVCRASTDSTTCFTIYMC